MASVKSWTDRRKNLIPIGCRPTALSVPENDVILCRTVKYRHAFSVCNNIKVEVEVTLRLTVSQSVCLGIEHPCWTCDQILLPAGMLLSEICGLVSVGRPLWREDGSEFCSAFTHGPSRAEPVTILYCLIWGCPNLEVHVPPGTGWPSYSPGHWVPFTSTLTTRRDCNVS
jgi:hypothetical protein